MKAAVGPLGPPIARSGIPEQVVQKVLDLIRQGVLRPGQKLPPEREFALSIGVGRPSVREALRALSIMGVVDIRQGDGVFVSSLSPEVLLAPLHFFLSLETSHLDALFEARIIIECGITELAASRMDGDVLEALRACLDEGARSLDEPEAFLQVDVRFHQLIVEATENAYLNRVAQSFFELGKASRAITVDLPGVRQQSHEDHEQVFAALAARDGARASGAMEVHLRNVRRAFRRAFVREPDDDGSPS
jgi:GntR family transcriptional regulator, transcriptional repressor for pyruvate dehydrogenase complex